MYERFNYILDWVKKDANIADVGCDHGILGIKAIEKGAYHVTFIDNKEEPLNKARINALEYLNDGDYSLNLSDGITDIDDNIDQVFILGMGGILISVILAKKRLKKDTIFILGPNNKESILRKFLMDNSFVILDEVVAKERGKYYEFLKVGYGKMKLCEEDLMFGPILRKNKTKEFIQKWQLIKNKYENFLNEENKANLLKKIELIEKELA